MNSSCASYECYNIPHTLRLSKRHGLRLLHSCILFLHLILRLYVNEVLYNRLFAVCNVRCLVGICKVEMINAEMSLEK